MKKSRILVSLALVAFMVLMSIIPAFAAGDDEIIVNLSSTQQIEGTESDPAQGAITKLLQMPHGTNVPQTTFKFTVTPISVDGDNDSTVTAAMPEIGTLGEVEIEFPPVGTPPAYTFKEIDKNGIDYYYLESSELFASVSWPHAGVYVYEIEELKTTFANKGTYPDAPYEIMTFSSAKYTVSVYVKDGNQGTYVFFVGAVKTTKEDGQPGTEKVDPTPGSESNEFDYSQMIFINTYVKANGGTDPEDEDDWTLSISKVVSGDFASTSTYFKYDLKIITPSLLADPNASYKGYVVEKDATGAFTIVTSTANGANALDNFILFGNGTAGTFYLKHGQYLVFTDTPVGTSYEITEFGTSGYTPSVIVTYDSVADAEEKGLKGAALILPDANNTTYDYTLYVGETKNSADFTNKNETETPTGLDLNDLPFIGMIILAIGGFITFIAFKARKRKATLKNAAANCN